MPRLLQLILKQLLRSSRVDAPFTVTRHVLSGISLLDAPSLDAEHDTGIHLALEAMLPQAQEYGPAMTRLIKRMTLFRPGHFLLSEPQVAKIARMCTALRAVDLYDFTVTDYHIEWLANGLGCGPRLA